MANDIRMDDLRIPAMAGDRAPVTTSYRARRPGTDSGMRAMVIAAAALGGVLLVGLGGWALMGTRPATVPVIEADSRPLRVKPEHAGGMQVAGAEELGGVDRMAPPTEVPAPQALRAQMQQNAPAASAPPDAPAPVSPFASPLPDTPLRQVPVARTAATAVPAAAPAAAAPAAGAPAAAPTAATPLPLPLPPVLRR